jgi:hypothetical protein
MTQYVLTEKYKMTQYVGVYCFEWDPETGSHKKIHISETLCNLLDMHTEELTARVRVSEHMIANTEMEVLSILLNEITSLGIYVRSTSAEWLFVTTSHGR